MFTGLVEALGTVHVRQADGNGGAILTVVEPSIAPQLVLGESIAVNGACLTVIRQTRDSFDFQMGPETLARTNLGRLQAGDRVNLERSLRVGDRLGGHFVQGHVDAIGQLLSRQPSGEWDHLTFSIPEHLAALCVNQGSIAVDGVSLTIVEVTTQQFRVMLIPHTLSVTTLGLRAVGDVVNLEVDMLAKHVYKLVRLPEFTHKSL